MTDTVTSTSAKTAPKRQRRMARESNGDATATAQTPAPLRPQTKASLVTGLLQSSAGATLDELCQATGWLPHTCRAFLTGLRKKGHQVGKEKRENGATLYRITEVEAAS